MADTKERVARAPDGKWVKGQSGNPRGGRKGFKGMASYIRSQTTDGEELVDFALSVFRNVSGEYLHVHQWDALKWLASYGFGRPPQTVDLNMGKVEDLPDLPDVSELDAAKLAELDSLIGEILKGTK